MGEKLRKFAAGMKIFAIGAGLGAAGNIYRTYDFKPDHSIPAQEEHVSLDTGVDLGAYDPPNFGEFFDVPVQTPADAAPVHPFDPVSTDVPSQEFSSDLERGVMSNEAYGAVCFDDVFPFPTFGQSTVGTAPETGFPSLCTDAYGPVSKEDGTLVPDINGLLNVPDIPEQDVPSVPSELDFRIPDYGPLLGADEPLVFPQPVQASLESLVDCSDCHPLTDMFEQRFGTADMYIDGILVTGVDAKTGELRTDTYSLPKGSDCTIRVATPGASGEIVTYDVSDGHPVEFTLPELTDGHRAHDLEIVFGGVNAELLNDDRRITLDELADVRPGENYVILQPTDGSCIDCTPLESYAFKVDVTGASADVPAVEQTPAAKPEPKVVPLQPLPAAPELPDHLPERPYDPSLELDRGDLEVSGEPGKNYFHVDKPGEPRPQERERRFELFRDDRTGGPVHELKVGIGSFDYSSENFFEKKVVLHEMNGVVTEGEYRIVTPRTEAAIGGAFSGGTSNLDGFEEPVSWSDIYGEIAHGFGGKLHVNVEGGVRATSSELFGDMREGCFGAGIGYGDKRPGNFYIDGNWKRCEQEYTGGAVPDYDLDLSGVEFGIRGPLSPRVDAGIELGFYNLDETTHVSDGDMLTGRLNLEYDIGHPGNFRLNLSAGGQDARIDFSGSSFPEKQPRTLDTVGLGLTYEF